MTTALSSANYHLHIIATDCCFANTDLFMAAPDIKAQDLDKLFRCEMFEILRAEGKTIDAVIENIKCPANGAVGCKHWYYSGFNVYSGPDFPRSACAIYLPKKP